MTRDDVIRMREQADDWAEEHLQCMGEFHPDFLTVSDERFAALVAERDRIANEAKHIIKRAEARGAAAEREACAKVCEQEVCPCCWTEDAQAVAEHLAERIRARGQS
jgi:CRISPR/Cas system CSM-associated protein Csm5 (group 7 of RAMP superfamily)